MPVLVKINRGPVLLLFIVKSGKLQHGVGKGVIVTLSQKVQTMGVGLPTIER
jgi:hypothetical protein